MDPEKLVRGYLEALSDGRLDDAEGLLAEDGTYWMLSKRAAVPAKAWFAGYRKATDVLFTKGISFTVTGLTVQGPRVAAQVECHADLPSGAVYANAYHFLFEAGADRLTAIWEYGDTLHAEQVLRG
ncbi:MAG TPA: nuclear transport factor 2 family protein [Sporichthyaceae bacterium]